MADFHRAMRVKQPAEFAEKLPPHSIEAEQGVLGCVLLEPSCLAEAVGLVKEAEDFYDLRHQTIWREMVRMFDERIDVDAITLHQRLKDHPEGSQVDACGGLAYIAGLADAVPSAANLSYYANIVNEKSLLRQAIQTFTNAIGRIYDYEGEVEPLIESVEKKVFSLIRGGNVQLSTKEAVQACVGRIERAMDKTAPVDGVTTGLVDLDKLITRIPPGEMVVLAARPSTGKTALATNIADHVAVTCAAPVGVFSLEMTTESLIMRMLCARASVDSHSILEGFITERDCAKLISACGPISNAPLHIDDSVGLTVTQLRSRAMRLHQRHALKLIVVDYLQLMLGQKQTKKDFNRQQEISEISGGIKSLAKELQLPIIALSQLNRDSEKGNRRPKLSDLRESGAIEQDADQVWLLSKEDGGGFENVPVLLDVAKNRNGRTGEVHLTFRKPITKFECAAKVTEDDVPNTYQYE